MSELSLHRVSKVYNPGLFKKKVQAVCDLSLEVAAGEVYGLIGPNGAGKSTTIRLMLGLIRPDSGTIHFRGKPLAATSIQKMIGYLPENPYLYDHLTLEELLRFCGQTSGMTVDRYSERIEKLLAKVDMTSARRRALRTFSKGMLQRAGICFALLHDPEVVILDEPMSGLDPIGRRMVFDIVLELKEEGKTVFFCSHILSDVGRLCDRIGMIARGQLIREFKAEQFREDLSRPIHLVLEPLADDQRQALTQLVGQSLDDNGAPLVSVAPGQLADLMGQLGELGIGVRATRSERVSLEELFLNAIREKVQ